MTASKKEKKERLKDKRRIPVLPFFFGCLLPVILIGGLIWFNPFKGRPAGLPTMEENVKTSHPTLKGSGAKPDSTLAIIVDGKEVGLVVTDEKGNFVFSIDITKGKHIVEAIDRNDIGGGDAGKTVWQETIIYDGGPYSLVITSPLPGEDVGSEAQVVGQVIPSGDDNGSSGDGDSDGDGSGDSPPGDNGDGGSSDNPSGEDSAGGGGENIGDNVNISVDGEDVPVGDDGTFEDTVDVNPEDDTITIIVTDNSGETIIETIIDVNDDGGDTGGDNGDDGNNGGDQGGGDQGGGDNGGGTTPPADNGGATTPPADNGGGTTTPPADNGDTTPPPVVIYPSKVIISFIRYAQDDNGNPQEEYVEVRNTGEGAKNLSGYTVSDSDGNVFTFPAFTIQPGQVVRINTNGSGFSFAVTFPVWNRVGEPAYLKDGEGILVDLYSYQ